MKTGNSIVKELEGRNKGGQSFFARGARRYVLPVNKDGLSFYDIIYDLTYVLWYSGLFDINRELVEHIWRDIK